MMSYEDYVAYELEEARAALARHHRSFAQISAICEEVAQMGEMPESIRRIRGIVG